MRTRPLLSLFAAALFASACAQVGDTRANVAGNRYLACLNASADRNLDNPASAELIATTAHGECWSEWQAYREQTVASFAARAKTAEEKQLARDKADAHLRQFEFDARKAVMSRVVRRTYGVPASPGR